MNSKIIKMPFSPIRLLREGLGSNVTFSAEGKSLKFHREIIEKISPPLTTALETKSEIIPGQIFNLELNCSFATLKMIHQIIYGTPPDEKTSLTEIWETYCFAEQYDIAFIVDYLRPAILKLIDVSEIPTLLELIVHFTSDVAKPFMEPTYDRFVSLMLDLGDEVKFCTENDCCKHTAGDCMNNTICCKCRAKRPPAAIEHRNKALDQIYDAVETLPSTIRRAIFRAMG